MHWLSTAIHTYFLHSEHGNGYQWWSGPGSDLGEASILVALGMFWRKHNCHVHHCWRISWHEHPEHGHPVCRKHHPSGNADYLDARHH